MPNSNENDKSSHGANSNSALVTYTTNAAHAAAAATSTLVNTMAPVIVTSTAVIVHATTELVGQAKVKVAEYFTEPPKNSSSSSSPNNTQTTPAAANNNLKKNKRRKVSPYSANMTAALSLPDQPQLIKNLPSWGEYILSFFQTKKTNQTMSSILLPDLMRELEKECSSLRDKDDAISLSQLDNILEKKIDNVAQLIVEHAARRIDLFFYSCIAAYGLMEVTAGAADRQHGKGHKEFGTHACHSALFSRTEENFLRETLNMTVELPKEVNEFDKHLEGLYGKSLRVKEMERLLDKIKNEKLYPHKAMTQFLRIMEDFFQDFETKYFSNTVAKASKSSEEQKIFNLPKTFKKIWELEKAGSFKCAKKVGGLMEVDMNYIYAELKIHEWGNAFHSWDHYYNRIIQEIKNAKIESDTKPAVAPK